MIKKLFCLISISMAVVGCATQGNAISKDGSTMAQVYEEAMQESGGEALDVARSQVSDHVSLTTNQNNASADTRTTQNEIHNQFPLLPNPSLVMYVYPHLVGEAQAPVPGYSTAFPLYEKIYYALPGEVVN